MAMSNTLQELSIEPILYLRTRWKKELIYWKCNFAEKEKMKYTNLEELQEPPLISLTLDRVADDPSEIGE